MSNKYEETCWYCGRAELDVLPDHVVCRHCGATWNPLPKEGHYPISMQPDYGTGEESPSPSLIGQKSTTK